MVKDNGLGLGGMFDYNYYYNIEDSSIWLRYTSSPEKTDETELFQISAPIESVRVVQGERKYDTEIYTDLPGTGKFGLISYGNITVPIEYDGYYRLSDAFYYFDSVYGFSEEGRIVFYKDNKIYVFDENGKCYSEGKYDVDENANQEKYYYQGYLPVSLDGKWGYIDIYGNEVVSCQFEDVTSVFDGKAWVKKDGKWGVIELTNEYQNPAIEETPYAQMSEDELKNIISVHGIIGAWHYADYDGNGSKEAFAVIISDDEENSRPIEAVYYVDSTGKSEIMSTNLNLCLYKRDDGCYCECSEKGFFWFDMGAYGSGWHSAVYSVKDGVPYELDISQNVQGFYQDGNNKFYTTKDEFLPGGGHLYHDYELIFNGSTQQFSVGNKIDIADQSTESNDNPSSNM